MRAMVKLKTIHLNYIGNASTYPLVGFVIRKSPNLSETMLNELVVKNNVFINWPKRKKPIQINEAIIKLR